MQIKQKLKERQKKLKQQGKKEKLIAIEDEPHEDEPQFVVKLVAWLLSFSFVLLGFSFVKLRCVFRAS